MHSIGLIGKIGSGKDTAATLLMLDHGYQRVAFADPLKEMVREADPIVGYEPAGYGPIPIHLTDVLRRMSFEQAKREYREVRRSLQRIGQGARKIDPDFWVRLALLRINELPAGVPVVVSDVRYPNEADALRARGFVLVRVTSNREKHDAHESETALDAYPATYEIGNNGTIGNLGAQLRQLI